MTESAILHYHLSWWNWVWTSVTAVSSVMLIVKVGAYLIELRWLNSTAPTIRWEWAHRTDFTLSAEQSYLNLQTHSGRPEPIFKQIRSRIKPDIAASAFNRLSTSPALILVSALSMTMAGNAAPWLLDLAACVISLAAAVMLTTAIAGRLLLGSLDTLNSDLQPRAGLGAIQVADVPQLRLVYYFLVLAFIAVTATAGASAAVANAHAGAFLGTGLRSPANPVPNIDPIPYFYYSVVTIATVGYGDIVPQSDLARLLTVIHIATGPLLFAWLVAVFTQPTAQVATAFAVGSSRSHDALKTECRNHEAASCVWRIANPLAGDDGLDQVT